MQEEVKEKSFEELTEGERLELALQERLKVNEAKERLKKLTKKLEDEEDKQKKRRDAIDKAKDGLKELRNKVKSLRSFTNVKREANSVRQKNATKGFFTLLNLCNNEDEDFSKAYNFIADTEWLFGAVMDCASISKYNDKIEIDRNKLRKKVFEKKAEVEKVIADFENAFKMKFKDETNDDDDKSADDVNDENAEEENPANEEGNVVANENGESVAGDNANVVDGENAVNES